MEEHLFGCYSIFMSAMEELHLQIMCPQYLEKKHV